MNSSKFRREPLNDHIKPMHDTDKDPVRRTETTIVYQCQHCGQIKKEKPYKFDERFSCGVC